ncbi:MAG TPA: hypothetical protein VLC53_01430 [Myxococcota bacterium]|nr:hypothetical protein [Myxococcota bacterium]
MSTQPEDAQHRLEQHALRNVRGLVDRIEADDALDRRAQRRMLVAVLVAVALLALAVGGWIASREGAARDGDAAIELPPVRPAPSK